MNEWIYEWMNYFVRKFLFCENFPEGKEEPISNDFGIYFWKIFDQGFIPVLLFIFRHSRRKNNLLNVKNKVFKMSQNQTSFLEVSSFSSWKPLGLSISLELQLIIILPTHVSGTKQNVRPRIWDPKNIVLFYFLNNVVNTIIKTDF